MGVCACVRANMLISKGDLVFVKYLKITSFQMKNSAMKEFRMVE